MGSVYYPVGKVQFSRDYHHRITTIDFLISLHRWAEDNDSEVEFIDAYYHVEGSQRISRLTRKTQVSLGSQVIVPDLNFMIAMKDGERRLFTAEIHLQPKATRIVEQLKQHTEIIRQELLSDKYSHHASHRVLNVFSHLKTMESVKSVLHADHTFEDVAEHFLFASLGSTLADFSQSWCRLAGSQDSLFAK